MYVKVLSHNLFFFQFYHEVDITNVIQGSPWTFDRKQLIIQRLKEGENPKKVTLDRLEMWVQIHDLQVDFMTEKVIKDIANYIGTFVESDPKIFTGVWREYM